MEPSNDIVRTLGRLEGQFALVLKSVDEIHGELRTMAETSRAERAKMEAAVSGVMKDISDLKGEVYAVKPKVESLAQSMTDVLPVVAQVSKWRTTGTGVILGISAVAAVFSTFLSTAKDRLMTFLFG